MIFVTCSFELVPEPNKIERDRRRQDGNIVGGAHTFKTQLFNL